MHMHAAISSSLLLDNSFEYMQYRKINVSNVGGTVSSYPCFAC